MKENETLQEAKTRQELANRGKRTEKAVHDFLKNLKETSPQVDFDRLQDGRATGRPGVAQVCDYMVYFNGRAIALEVKNVKKGGRLSKFVQGSRMVRREMAGVKGFVIVNFNELDLWAVLPISWIKESKPSWLADHLLKFPDVGEAVVYTLREGSK